MAFGLYPLLLALLLGLSAAYDCPGNVCKPPGCMCASNEPPLTPAPQFIVLTNDDAATVITTPAVLSMLDNAGVTNPNGCGLPVTWYISVEYTQAEYVQMVYMKGHEIATHTYHHVGLANATEILGARKWLNETAGVPLHKIRGFRGPYLLHDVQQRDTLAAGGFLYDSTITTEWGPGKFSPDGAHMMWPFTMDYGVPIDCSTGTGPCSEQERLPGLWEFPMADLQNDDGTVVASMDPAGVNVTEVYIRELLRRYRGNRAPLGVYFHAARFVGSQAVADEYSAFLRYALTLPDVWVVTVAEVLRWMANPVPVSEYNLSCPTPTDMTFASGKFCLPPASGCVQGTWRAAQCTCVCINSGDAALPGFCPDPSTGTCTVVKEYSWATQRWSCPGDANHQDDITPVPSSPSGSGATGRTTPMTGSSTPATSPGSSSGGSSSAAGQQGQQQQQAASVPAARPTTSSPAGAAESSAGFATVQPLAGVQVSFVARGQVSDFAVKGQAVCNVLAALAGEPATSCTIVSVANTAAPSSVSTRRLSSTGYVLVVSAIKPVVHTETEVAASLDAARADGRLGAALSAAAGVQLAEASPPSVDVSSAAHDSSSGTVAAAVGGAIGGAAVVCVSIGIFLVVRARRQHAQGGTGRLPVSTRSQDDDAGGKHKPHSNARGLTLKATAGPSRLGECAVSAYATTPRSGATPRHAMQVGPFHTVSI